MTGCRPLTDEEIREVCKSFYGDHARRDKALFLLGVATGYRISELLSLRVSDVYQYEKIVDTVTVQRRNMKRKTAGRTVILSAMAKRAISEWLDELGARAALEPDMFLFKSRKGENKAITRQMADKILRDAFAVCELAGTVATHSMRKTFANKVYDNLQHDLVRTQRALGHTNINSTVKYMAFREEEIDEAIAAIDIQ